jgi:hypothetical protein
MRIARFIVAMALASAPCAIAQTLYKLIDKDGKVTYSQEKPKNFDGQVIPLNIDPNANTATLPKLEGAPMGGDGIQRRPTGGPKVSRDQEIYNAQDRLNKAKEALQNAKEHPGPDDMMMVGKVGGGVRYTPSEDYQKRLDQLEKDVKDAQDALDRAQSS